MNGGRGVPVAAVLDTPFGALRLTARDDVLTGAEFVAQAAPCAPRDGVLGEAARQVEAYCAGRRKGFDVPLAPAGTPFQRRVWAALQAIPYGQRRRYGELAAAVRSAPRAVGGACRANPWVLIVPCHRAVGGAGLGGFMGESVGAWPALKAALLAHEAACA